MTDEKDKPRFCALPLERRVSRCVFAFEWCPCIFESAFALVNLHTTKRGAFCAMTEAANTRWYEHRARILSGGYSRPRPNGLDHEAWRVRRIEVANEKIEQPPTK